MGSSQKILIICSQQPEELFFHHWIVVEAITLLWNQFFSYLSPFFGQCLSLPASILYTLLLSQMWLSLNSPSHEKIAFICKKKKVKFPLQNAEKHSKGFKKLLPIAIILLPFSSFLFHFSPTTFPPNYLAFSLWWENYCLKKQRNNFFKWREVLPLDGCDELCSHSCVLGEGGAPHMGLWWEVPFFCPSKSCSWLC